MKVRTKWHVLVFLGVLVMALSAGPVMAEQAVKIKGKRFGVVIDQTRHVVEDAKGHIVGISVSEGVDVLFKGTFRSISYLDGQMPKGGAVQGWSTAIFPNGDKNYTKFVGRMEGKVGPTGQPMMLMHGTWKFVSGTGKWAGVQGGGTFKGQYLGKNIYTYDWEGEYTIKK